MSPWICRRARLWDEVYHLGKQGVDGACECPKLHDSSNDWLFCVAC